MKLVFATLAALFTFVSSVPTPETDPVRILPKNWQFNILSLKGSGCPKDDPDAVFKTRLTFGSNTMDGTEIYHWFVAYPNMFANVNAGQRESHVWCEATIKYSEYGNYPGDDVPKKETADYNLRLHKNGTQVIAAYDVWKGTDATWKFTYYPEDDEEVVDTIKINGPYGGAATGSAAETVNLQSPVSAKSKPFPLPQCGSSTFKFRTDLYLKAGDTKGTAGTVFAGDRIVKDGKTYNYGSQVGFSYDWQKCSK